MAADTPILIDPVRFAYAVQFNSGLGDYDITTANNLLSFGIEAVISTTPDLTLGEEVFALGIGPHAVIGAFTYAGAVEAGGAFIGYLLEKGGKFYLVSETPPAVTAGEPITVHPNISWDQATNQPACFVGGTMIATPAGEVRVETLRPGDMVTLATGGAAPVIWLGRRSVAALFADPLKIQPIRVMAHALGDGMPARDLLVSPDHALLVEGVLVHAGALINGISILRETGMPENFIYYHIELDRHGLILAENAPAESFIDNVDRMAFDNWAEHPNHTGIMEMDLPRAKSARQIPAGVKTRLEQRAITLCGMDRAVNVA